LENHPAAGSELRAAIKRQVRNAFYVDTAEWKGQVVAQAIDVAAAAVRGLAASIAAAALQGQPRESSDR
jgi:hypothetical protein